MARAPMAIQVGLNPGFALQDGDLIARLIAGAGSWALGSTVDLEARASGNNSMASAYEVRSSVVVLTHVTATENSVRLPNSGLMTIVRVFNMTPNVARIFPPDGDSRIDAVSPGHSVWLSGNARCDYLHVGTTRWLSTLLGSASA